MSIRNDTASSKGSIEVGDIITVRMVVTHNATKPFAAAVKINNDVVGFKDSDIVEVRKRSYAVGDMVNIEGSTAKILCIDDGEAFLRYASGAHTTAPIKFLVRA